MMSAALEKQSRFEQESYLFGPGTTCTLKSDIFDTGLNGNIKGMFWKVL